MRRVALPLRRISIGAALVPISGLQAPFRGRAGRRAAAGDFRVGSHGAAGDESGCQSGRHTEFLQHSTAPVVGRVSVRPGVILRDKTPAPAPRKTNEQLSVVFLKRELTYGNRSKQSESVAIAAADQIDRVSALVLVFGRVALVFGLLCLIS